jgi:hypothetical protein
MAFGIKTSFEQGFANLVSATGLSLSLAFSSIYFISDSLISSTSLKYSSLLIAQARTTISLPLSDSVLVVLYGVVSAASVVLTVCGFRAFVYGKGLGRTLSQAEPISVVKDSLLLVITGLSATLPILAGSLLLVVPGFYVAVSFVFFPALISTESAGLSALKRSWKLVKNSRIRLFGLLLAVLVATSASSLIVFYTGLNTTAVLVAGLETVFGIAVVSEAFKQLSRGGETN